MRQAVILCGGRGRRLAPITHSLPKALIPFGGVPLLRHQIFQLHRHKVEEVILCVGYGAELIRATCGSGSEMGVRIVYSEEPKPLGTAGAVKAIKHSLDPHFFVIYGDLIFTVNLTNLAREHFLKGALATLVLHPSDHPYDSDIVVMNHVFRITEFLGKPKTGQKFLNLTNAAIYALDRRIIDSIPVHHASDFALDVFPSLLRRGQHLAGFVTEDYCKDIGQPDRYQQALEDFNRGRVRDA